jgi:hypothetical protein
MTKKIKNFQDLRIWQICLNYLLNTIYSILDTIFQGLFKYFKNSESVESKTVVLSLKVFL